MIRNDGSFDKEDDEDFRTFLKHGVNINGIDVDFSGCQALGAYL